jgi:hypothetical protein
MLKTFWSGLGFFQLLTYKRSFAPTWAARSFPEVDPTHWTRKRCFLSGRESGPRDPFKGLARPHRLAPGLCFYTRTPL